MALPTHRWFLGGLGAVLAAPAIIRTSGLLMPIRPLVLAAPPLVLAHTFITVPTARLHQFHHTSDGSWRIGSHDPNTGMTTLWRSHTPSEIT
jgi:hypothetical protein